MSTRKSRINRRLATAVALAAFGICSAFVRPVSADTIEIFANTGEIYDASTNTAYFSSFNGTNFTTSVSGGVRTFTFYGDLNIANDNVIGVGSLGTSLVSLNNANISGSTFNYSASGSTAGAGGGNGGNPGSGGAGGSNFYFYTTGGGSGGNGGGSGGGNGSTGSSGFNNFTSLGISTGSIGSNGSAGGAGVNNGQVGAGGPGSNSVGAAGSVGSTGSSGGGGSGGGGGFFNGNNGGNGGNGNPGGNGSTGGSAFAAASFGLPGFNNASGLFLTGGAGGGAGGGGAGGFAHQNKFNPYRWAEYCPVGQPVEGLDD